MTAVPTPASRTPPPTALVLGAGIAGLTAAHELAERGFAVTVIERNADERTTVGDLPPDAYPPVKLGGLAASQYTTFAPQPDQPQVRLRPFPGRRGAPRPPQCAVPGEHGFRFFPAYYLHIWDLLQRIPVYECQPGGSTWRRIRRTVMDNVQRVVTQATTVHGKPSLIFPREAPRSLPQVLTAADQIRELGATAADAATFGARILRYLVTSPLRRASELQNLSLYDFFIGRDASAARRYGYSPQVEALVLDMPKVLAAFDSRWGDARTNISTYLQLMLRTDRDDDKADGVLNGPTTEAWFDSWYHHLLALGVRFRRGSVDSIDPPVVDRRVPPHRRPRVQVGLADGSRYATDYVVCALDAPTAERVTAALRRTGTGGTVADLEGFTTSTPPPAAPLQPQATRPGDRRDPYAMDTLGRRSWDRFQTLAGLQLYFDTEFQLVRGHVYYSGSDWGLSSINQQGLWENRPALGRDGYVSRLSVDIGDFNTPSSLLLDEHGRGKAARDCSADEIAAEVWRQIVAALTSAIDDPPESTLPWPVWYSLDRNLVFAEPDCRGRPIHNEAPYLVPIVGDWPNRPGAEPWNPNMSSWTTVPTEAAWQDELRERDVWQARHGGYEVHHNSLVFAGTWTKTFTRLTTMEAACESARHAVNAVLDHYVWVGTEGTDRRGGVTLDWRIPFDFLDQGLSVPVRQPSPAGDYCFVFDMENREPFDARRLRNLDSTFARSGYPHPLDVMGLVPPALSQPPSSAEGAPMTTPPTDYTGNLLTYLQVWRQYLEQLAAPSTPPARGYPPVPPVPSLPAMPVMPSWPWVPPPPPSLPFPSVPVPPPIPPQALTTPAPTSTWPTSPPGGASGPLAPAPPGPPIPPVVPNAPESGASTAGIGRSPAPAPHAAPADPTALPFDGGAYGTEAGGAIGPVPQARKARLVGSAFSWAVETGASPDAAPDQPAPQRATATAPTATTRDAGTVLRPPRSDTTEGAPPFRHVPNRPPGETELIPPRFGEFFAHFRRPSGDLGGGSGWWSRLPLPDLPKSVGAGGLPPWRFPGVQGLPTNTVVPPLTGRPTADPRIVDPRIVDPRIGINAALRRAPSVEIRGADPQA